MKNMKFWRTALVAALVLTVMLSVTGGTIAWFTDEVTSKGNVIEAGTLQIDLLLKEGNDFVSLKENKDKAVLSYDKWEPGYTAVKTLKIENKGTLALEYVLKVIPNGEIKGQNGESLADVIDVYMAFKPGTTEDFSAIAPAKTAGEAGYNGWWYSGTLASLIANEKGFTQGYMLPKQGDENDGTVVKPGMPGTMQGWCECTIALHMQEEAGNEYQGLSLGAAFVELTAKQYTHEPDSFGPDYDKDATYGGATYVNNEAALKAAIENAADGSIIVLTNDIKSADGYALTGKDVTIDLNGKTITSTEGASTNNRVFKISGDSNVIIKNGTLIAEGELTSGAYGTVRTEDTANVTLENVKMYSYRGYGLNVKAYPGTKVTITNSEIYAQYSGGVEAAGGTVELNNVKIEQKGVYSGAAWCSVALGVNGGGKIIVNSGDYSAAAIADDDNAAQGTWVAYVMSSGGDLIINDGNFNGTIAETADAANACGIICADTAAVVEINGGTFNSNGAILDMRNNTGLLPNPVATLKGGTFSADPCVSGLYGGNLIQVADGHEVIESADGKWVVTAQ